MSAPVTIRIQDADFDIAKEIAALTMGRTDIGAVVSFSGICRGSEGTEKIAALTLEHYPGMAEAEIKRHADEAMSRWPLDGLTVIHRFGRIQPGENIVLVVTASQHRQAAFHAAECRGRRTPDAARFRPLCGEPFPRSQTCLRARHHRSGRRSRVPGVRSLASSSRSIRDVCRGAGDSGRTREDPRLG